MTGSRLFRIAVAVALTAFVLFWKTDPSDVARVAAGADLGWVAAAIALVLIDRALMAWRWIVLLRALTPGSRPPFGAVLRIFFVSTFVGTFLPSVGGDVYRAYSLSRLDVIGAESAASVLMDRVLGVLSIAIVGVVAMSIAGPAAWDRGIVATLMLAAAGCAVAAVAVFSERAATAAQQVVGRVTNARLQRLAAGLAEAVRRYSNHHGDLLNVLAMSVLVQVIRVVQAYCLGRGLGIDAPFWAYFAFIPLILLIVLVPVSISGFGTAQVAFDWLFGRVGVSSAEAFALSVLFIALGIVGNLPGGVLYALGPARTAPDGRAP